MGGRIFFNTGLPDGGISYFNGFASIGDEDIWWSSTEGSTEQARHLNLNYRNTAELWHDSFKGFGFSVWCLKD